jgi:hypothetical protein
LSSLNSRIEFGVAELGGGVDVVVDDAGVDDGDIVDDVKVLTAMVVEVPISHCNSYSPLPMSTVLIPAVQPSLHVHSADAE